MCSATTRRDAEPSSLLADGADPTAITDALAGVTHVLYAPDVGRGHLIRRRIRLVQRRAEADRRDRRDGCGAAAVSAHPQRPARQ